MNRTARGVLLGSAALATLRSTAYASVEPPPEPGFSFPSAQDIAREVAHAVGDYLGGMVNQYIRDSLPALLTRGLLAVFGFFGRLLWELLAVVFGPMNFITTIPEQWTVGLPPIQRFIVQFTVLGLSIVGCASVWTTVRLLMAMASFQNYHRFLRFYQRQVLAAAIISFALPLITFLLQFANALSTSIVDPLHGLANLANTPDWSNFSAFGAILLVYGFVAFRFAIMRAKIMVLTGLCIALTPLMIAVWCIPIDKCEQLFELWATFLTGMIFIQVPQAVAIAIGASLVAAALTTGSTGTDTTTGGIVAGFMGIGSIMAAGAMPSMINRRIFRQNQGGGAGPQQWAKWAHMAMMAAGVAVAPPAAAPYAVAQQVGQRAAGNYARARVVSVLATTAGRATQVGGPSGFSGQKLLPPPRG